MVKNMICCRNSSLDAVTTCCEQNLVGYYLQGMHTRSSWMTVYSLRHCRREKISTSELKIRNSNIVTQSEPRER
jgi:hypothetical protein